MTEVPWTRVVPLGDEHDLDLFRSGRDSVDTWLREKARGASHLIATHVGLDAAGTVVGFFALGTAIVETGGLPSRLRRGSNAEGQLTAVLLAQLGLEVYCRGTGTARLCSRAAREAAVWSRVCRIPLLVLDAADEQLVPFDESFRMRRIPNSLRLAALLAKIPSGPS